MEKILFEELMMVRNETLKGMEGITEEVADRIPTGFRNNIRWQLGHIYTITEFLAFLKLNHPMNLPDGFAERYSSGKSPLDEIDNSLPLPTLPELEKLLKEQWERIREGLAGRLNENVPTLNTSIGLGLNTPEQMIRYNLYHEGLHFGIIKVYKKILTQ